MLHTYTSYYKVWCDLFGIKAELSFYDLCSITTNQSKQPTCQKNRRKKGDPQPYCHNSERENGT